MRNTANKLGICIIALLFAAIILLITDNRTGDYCARNMLFGKATWYKDEYVAAGKKYTEGYYAAMWDVPLGTKVRVTNMKNGRSVTVEINDRGPNKMLVAKGRVIDLARQAFLDLGDSLDAKPLDVKVEILKTK
ncbi:MAG TPA: septal ring lytic transglycosylase RlpA family protein [Candidatus Omnitrophota bacterium]|nr:septal ring lytic transglycosylase RlpA family protein [Candidatus Omnitrophota bacterium]HPS20767.1 septal ring lytic transglycosylase RlpA family protein [Candidatus Omnitrophota bacterium]